MYLDVSFAAPLICALFEKEPGIKIVFMGFGLDSDNLHSPNEKFNIANFYKGIETIPYFHRFFYGDEIKTLIKKEALTNASFFVILS